jgi:GAF domain-containing protein
MTAQMAPVLAAILEAGVATTGAGGGWLLAVRGDRLAVVAAAGSDLVAGATVAADEGTAGFVVASGQPLAMAPRDGDERFAQGVMALTGRRPTSVLTVPCATDAGVLGAIELVDKAGGGAFGFDDVELATVLADIAAVALSQLDDSQTGVPDPAVLGGELARLAAASPARYAAVATVLGALLANG